jgi:hypothetical protein
MEMNGLYKIKPKYFLDFPSPNWMEDKKGRPYYYCICDSDGIFWMIPLSSQVDNYKKKIAKEESKRGAGNCAYYHIGLIAGIERAFIISDMFPIADNYIDSAYTIGGRHYVAKDKNLVKGVRSRAMRYLNLVKSGAIKNQFDIMGIKRKLLNRKTNKDYII